MSLKLTRRTVVGGLASSAAFPALAQNLTLPSSPVTLNFVDVAGNLALTQKAIEAYRDKKPQLVSRVTFSKAPAPELPGKIKAQQDAGRVDIDGVLTGIDGLSAGVDQKLWIPIAIDYAAKLPRLEDIYLPGAQKMQQIASNQGVCIVFCPAGPVMEYMPDKVKQVPQTAEELLAWAKANPEPLHVCAPGELRPRPRVHDGPALHPRRQGPARSRTTAGTRPGPISRSSGNTSSTIRPAPARR